MSCAKFTHGKLYWELFSEHSQTDTHMILQLATNANNDNMARTAFGHQHHGIYEKVPSLREWYTVYGHVHVKPTANRMKVIKTFN